MTLLMLAIAKDAVHVSCDARLVDLARPGRALTDSSPKAIVVSAIGWQVVTVYTGLATLDGVGVPEWLSDVITKGWSKGLTPDDVCHLVRLAADRSILAVRSEDREQMPIFLVAGFWTTETYVRVVELAAPAAGYGVTSPARGEKFIAKGSGRRGVRRWDSRLIREALRRNAGPQQIQSLLATVNGRAARNPTTRGTVSETSLTFSLATDGTSSGRLHGFSSEEFVPRVITNGIDLTKSVTDIAAQHLQSPPQIKQFASAQTWETPSHESFNRRLSKNPDDINVLGEYAKFLQAEGLHDRAEAAFLRVIRLAPAVAGNLSNYGNFLWEIRKNPEAADEKYRAAIVIDQNDVIAITNLAWLRYREYDDTSTARELLETAVAKNAHYVDALLKLSQLLLDQGTELARAAQLARAAIAHDPTRDDAALIIGQLALRDGDVSPWEDLLWTCAKSGGGSTVRRLSVAWTFLLLGRVADGTRVLRAHPNLDQSEPAWCCAAAHAAMLEGQPAQIIEGWYKRALSLEPTDVAARVNYAQFLLRANRQADAGSLLTELRVDEEATPAVVHLEAAYYRFACFPKERPRAAARILQLVDDGVRSWGWDLSVGDALRPGDTISTEEIKDLADVLSGRRRLSDTLRERLSRVAAG
jgi:Tfp pilus assembly protein PilF